MCSCLFLKDLDDWDDVGVNTPRPPNLLHLFRNYGKHVVVPIEEDKEEIENLKEKIKKMVKFHLIFMAYTTGTMGL